jgi:uncharacterized protein (TIGR02099 family)
MHNLKLDGTVDFQGAALALTDWDLTLNDLRGGLRFSESGVQARGIKTKALGADVKIEVETPKEVPSRILIRARGRLGSQTLVDRAPVAAIAEPKGQADWLLTLDLPRKEGGGGPPHLTLESDLAGVSLGLPAPLGKPPESLRSLRVGIDLVAAGPYALALTYDGLLDGRFLLQRDAGTVAMLRGALRLGGGEAQMPTRDGLVLSGKLPDLDLAPWLVYGERHIQGSPEEAGASISRVDLGVGRLRYGDLFDLRHAAVALTAKADAWSGQVESRRFKGSIRIPRSLKTAPILVRLDHLDLDVSASDALGAAPRPPSDADPRAFPGLDLRVGRLRVNQADLGPLTVVANRIPQGLRFDHLDLDSEHLHAHGEGRWVRSARDGAHTQLDFKLSTGNPANVLSTLGFSPNVKAKTATLAGTLTWPGSPADLERRSLDGRLEMSVGEGQFLELEPGVGRMFGLLSLGTLQRRLSLDFSDLVGKGLSFDKIHGTFVLKEGSAFTKDLMIQGPSARLDLSGRIGLVKEDFDQRVTVTPQLTSSLPVAGAIAGGPAVGAALLVAQKLVGDRVNRMGRHTFTVTGPWSDPKVESVSRQESGAPPSKDSSAASAPQQPTQGAPQGPTQQQPQAPLQQKPAAR